jgi:putative ABC transport system ATP-binding protein
MVSFTRRSVTEFGQTIIMVAHDPLGAAYADRVVFLDGEVTGELVHRTPTP